MKLNSINNINFQKKLIATAGVIENKHPESCYIYELEHGKDDDYFSKVILGLDKKSLLKSYASAIQDEFNKNYLDNDVYVIENKDEDCLCAVQLEHDDIYVENNSIGWLASFKNREKNANVEYAGETMTAFLAHLQKEKGQDTLEVPHTRRAAKAFYEKCLFEPFTKGSCHYSLYEDTYNKLIKQNEEHSGRKIQFVV